MPKLTPPLTLEQQIAIAIIPKLTSSLSIIGSGFIVQHIVRSRKRRARVYHRILLGMGMMDLVSSFKSFLSTWPNPRGTAWGAVGTIETCAASGFFGHGSSLAGALYNGSLCLYYVLTINFGWRYKGSDKNMARLEPWLHVVPLTIGWSTAIAGLPLLLFNPIGWTCWIAPVPFNCNQSYQDPKGSTTCERGDNSYIYRWAFFHAELWLTFFLTAAGMALIYRHVLQREKTTERYGIGRSRETRRQSRHVAHQALLYVLAYWLTWIFPTVTWLTQLIEGRTYTIVLFLQAIFVPLQGAFNVCIYLRPRYLRYRDRNPQLSFIRAIRCVLLSSGDGSALKDRTERKRPEGETGGEAPNDSRTASSKSSTRQLRRSDPDVHSFYDAFIFKRGSSLTFGRDGGNANGIKARKCSEEVKDEEVKEEEPGERLEDVPRDYEIQHVDDDSQIIEELVD